MLYEVITLAETTRLNLVTMNNNLYNQPPQLYTPPNEAPQIYTPTVSSNQNNRHNPVAPTEYYSPAITKISRD